MVYVKDKIMRIGEISEKTGLSLSKLRYYEKHGLIEVARNANGLRNYDESDVEWVKFIQRLKETGMQIKEIRRYAELRYKGKSTMPERLEMLQTHKEYVLEQQRKWEEYLQNLEKKIEYYKKEIGK